MTKKKKKNTFTDETGLTWYYGDGEPTIIPQSRGVSK